MVVAGGPWMGRADLWWERLILPYWLEGISNNPISNKPINIIL